MTTEVDPWKRPESLAYPTVWWRCSGKKPMADGKIPNFRIQDATEEYFDEIEDYMSKVFIKDEHLCATAKMIEDPVSVRDFQKVQRKCLNQKVTLVALVEEEGEEQKGKRPKMAGFNILGVTRKTDKPMTSDMFEGKPARSVMEFILDFALKDVNVFEIYGVDEYMSALGLFVVPEYRGQGLSVDLLKARFPLARALNLKATMTFFSPVAAHRAAEKAGMHLIREAKFNDYVLDGKVIFRNDKWSSMKVMGARV